MIAQATVVNIEAKTAMRLHRVHNIRHIEHNTVRSKMSNLRDEFKSVIIRPKVLGQAANSETSTNIANDGSYTLFENPRHTKMLHEKYIQIRLVLGFVMITNVLLALSICEMHRRTYGSVSDGILAMSFTCTVFQLITAALWFVSLYFHGLLRREKLLMSDSVGIFADYGLLKLFGMLTSFIIHPFFIFIDMDFPVEETYYTKQFYFEYFKRPVAEYLIFGQAIVSSVHIIFVYLETRRMGNTRSDRIARFFSIEANNSYILRATMQRNPFQLCTTMYVFAVLFSATIFRIAENCYPIRMRQQYGSFDLTRAEFIGYGTSLWMVTITMATTGYGDIWIGSSFGRIVVIVTGLIGILMTSLFVLVSLNVLKMDRMEEVASNITRNTVLRKRKDQKANELISNILTGFLARIKDYDKRRLSNRKELFDRFDEFSAEHANFRLSCDSKNHHITIKSIRLSTRVDKMHNETVPVERSKQKLRIYSSKQEPQDLRSEVSFNMKDDTNQA